MAKEQDLIKNYFMLKTLIYVILAFVILFILLSIIEISESRNQAKRCCNLVNELNILLNECEEKKQEYVTLLTYCENVRKEGDYYIFEIK